MHMYGRVPKGKGVDRNMNQFYGRKSLNGLTLGEAGTLLFSAPVVIGATAALVRQQGQQHVCQGGVPSPWHRLIPDAMSTLLPRHVALA